jgi:hypothetical protein
MDANHSEPRPSPKQARILASCLRALQCDRARGNTAARQHSHERATKDIVMIPRMHVRGDVQEPGR